MQIHTPPAALIDIDAAAELLGMTPAAARAYLDKQNDRPVATYKNKSLWLSDTVHELIEKPVDDCETCKRTFCECGG